MVRRECGAAGRVTRNMAHTDRLEKEMTKKKRNSNKAIDNILLLRDDRCDRNRNRGKCKYDEIF